MLRSFSRTRLAPTPSGFLHIGNVLSFVLTAGLARKTGARILLRIDDLDRERVREAYVRDIFDSLHFLEIPWDEGPRDYVHFEKEYSQLHRVPIYEKSLAQLQSTGLVFACECSRSQLQQQIGETGYACACRDKGIPLEREGVSWRVRTDSQPITMQGLDGGGNVHAFPASMKDFIVRKKDVQAAYQLASVCDDNYFGVDLIVRGEDLLDSSLAQLYLSSLLSGNGFMGNAFFHHVLLKDTGVVKLSKSAGSTSIQYLRKAGKTKAEIFGMVLHQLGIQKTVTTWEKLADLLLEDIDRPDADR